MLQLKCADLILYTLRERQCSLKVYRFKSAHFTWVSIIKQHKKTIYEVLRHSCDDCNYKATQTTLLKEHKKSKHEGVK